jgi:hypothetical protein
MDAMPRRATHRHQLVWLIEQGYVEPSKKRGRAATALPDLRGSGHPAFHARNSRAMTTRWIFGRDWRRASSARRDSPSCICSRRRPARIGRDPRRDVTREVFAMLANKYKRFQSPTSPARRIQNQRTRCFDLHHHVSRRELYTPMFSDVALELLALVCTGYGRIEGVFAPTSEPPAAPRSRLQ